MMRIALRSAKTLGVLAVVAAGSLVPLLILRLLVFAAGLEFGEPARLAAVLSGAVTAIVLGLMGAPLIVEVWDPVGRHPSSK